MRYLWFLLLLSLSACVQQQQIIDQTSTAPRDLMIWLEQELSPYLTRQLTQDPRFRHQTIMLVRHTGSDIQADIDQLTRQLRQHIEDDLLSTPGIQLPWQPLMRTAKHHRRLSSAQCRQSRDANYYIGIEIAPILSGRHRVSVRALDMSERQWVGGFGLSWQGPLTGEEKDALSRLSIDESLRGLRTLPFTARQADMAADYLANNVSCLLQQQDEDQLLIHVQADEQQTLYMETLLRLVANNLSRYHEVSITDHAAKADFLLTLEAVSVQSDLDQLWVSIRHKHSGLRLSGMDTSTYIQRAPTAVAAPAGSSALVATKPVIQNLGLNRAVDPAQCLYASQHCALLTIDTLDSEDLFLIQHRAPAQLAYLNPASCNARIQSTGVKSRRYQLPVISDNEETTFHAIAVNQHSQNIIAAHLARLPRSCSNPTKSQEQEQMNQWLVQLEQIMQQQQQHISWAATR